MGSTQQTLKLRPYSASSLPGPVSPEKLACSPTLDLLICVDSDNVVSIRRAKGEQVSKPARRSGDEVVALRWKPDGQYVATAWSDGVVRLMGIESTKTLHQISHQPKEGSQGQQQPPGRINYIAWSRNRAGKARRHRDDLRGTAFGSDERRKTALHGADSDTWQDDALLSGETLAELSLDEHKEAVLDLPLEITFLEVETSLPKISPLPVSGGTGDDTFVFSSRASLDFVFREFKPEDADKVDVMLVGTEDGLLYLTIYDTFNVGTFRYSLPQPRVSPTSPPPPALRLVNHTSHPDVSTHSLLFQKTQSTQPSEAAVAEEELYLVPMDLCFVHSSPINLSLLASKITTLQKLLRYIHQTQAHMASEWSSARELPGRFLTNVSEDLKDTNEGPRDIVAALYHTVLTGHAHSVVKEWLVDSVAERGHKRWDKAVTSGLENLRGLIHENLLPALDRCTVILSRLLGIARFHDGGRVDIGFSAARVSRLIEVVSCLSLAANSLLVHVMDELELFATFSAWLRFQIDKLASPSASAGGAGPGGIDEMTEREASIDNARVLHYISTYLTSSPRANQPAPATTTGRRGSAGGGGGGGGRVGHPAAMFFGPVDEENFRKDRETVDDGVGLFDLLDRQIQRAAQGLPHMKALPRVDFLAEYLRSKAQAVFDDIAEAERRSVRFGPPTKLVVEGPIGKHEICMRAVGKSDGVDGRSFTAITPRGRPNELYIFRTNIGVINAISSAISTDVCAFSLTGGKLIDFKFLNADTLVVLWHPNGASPFLFRMPVQGAGGITAYAPYSDGVAPTPREISVQELMGNSSSSRMDFAPADNGATASGSSAPFVPIWMEVKEPSNARGHVPARVCLLGRDRVTYKVFELYEDLL